MGRVEREYEKGERKGTRVLEREGEESEKQESETEYRKLCHLKLEPIVISPF